MHRALGSRPALPLQEDHVARVRLRLRDGLIDLDAPVRVEANGIAVFEGRVDRTEAAIRRSLDERFDPASAATADLIVEWDAGGE